jgi:hypothetical protein
MSIKSQPAATRPREKLLALGPQALADAELLALLLRTGLPGQGVLELAQSVLEHCGGWSGLLRSDANALAAVKGLGPAKRAERGAVLEIARRAMAERLAKTPGRTVACRRVPDPVTEVGTAAGGRARARSSGGRARPSGVVRGAGAAMSAARPLRKRSLPLGGKTRRAKGGNMSAARPLRRVSAAAPIPPARARTARTPGASRDGRSFPLGGTARSARGL